MNIAIDSLKIEEFLADKGILKIDVSRKMGMNRSFVSNCTSRGYMKESNYILFCMILGVDKEMFLKKKADMKKPATNDNKSRK